MSHRPSTELVAQAWLELAAPGVRVGFRLPPVDDAMRTAGFVRTATVGGSPDRYVPLRSPVVVAECWVAPAAGATDRVPWHRAGALADQIVAATYDPTLMSRHIDLAGVGDYLPARVLSVMTVNEPRRVESDPANFARVDVDLLFAWRED